MAQLGDGAYIGGGGPVPQSGLSNRERKKKALSPQITHLDLETSNTSLTMV